MVTPRTRHPVFLLLGEPMAIDLVNTLVPAAFGGDLVATPDRIADWVEAEVERLPADAVEPPGVAAVGVLREALRTLFQAALDHTTPPGAPVRAVNAASRAGARYLELEWTARAAPRARPCWDRRAAGGHGAGLLVLGEIARSGIEVLGGPHRERLRRCEGPGCTLLFVALDPRRRWCAPHLCGNRVRVARHYRRRAEGRSW